MTLVRWVFLSIIGIILIVMAAANRQLVVLRLLPDEFADIFPLPGQIELPMFLVIFAGIIIGLLVGFLWEWMRERHHRQEAAARRREIGRLERELDGLRRKQANGDEDILALLE